MIVCEKIATAEIHPKGPVHLFNLSSRSSLRPFKGRRDLFWVGGSLARENRLPLAIMLCYVLIDDETF